VHGAGGLDELSTLGPNRVSAVADGKVTDLTIHPEDAGLPLATLDQLKGRDSAYNAARLNALLDGERDAYRDIVLLGAAAALQIAEKVEDLREGVTMAAAAIDSGKARQTLDGLIRITNS
jgi:anthranilate phosphoribosyltransferase